MGRSFVLSSSKKEKKKNDTERGKRVTWTSCHASFSIVCPRIVRRPSPGYAASMSQFRGERRCRKKFEQRGETMLGSWSTGWIVNRILDRSAFAKANGVKDDEKNCLENGNSGVSATRRGTRFLRVRSVTERKRTAVSFVRIALLVTRSPFNAGTTVGGQTVKYYCRREIETRGTAKKSW